MFNFLGPLANPARVRRQVLGVSDNRMAQKMAAVLQATGTERALIVWGHDGLDELTTTTLSSVVELSGGELRTYEVDPGAYGLRRADAKELVGGDAATNARLARAVLAGEPGAHRDVVVLNAAAALLAAGLADDISKGLKLAAAAIDSGQAAGAVDRLVAVSRQAAGT